MSQKIIASPFYGMMKLSDHRSKRSSSWDRAGKNRDWITISPHGKFELLNAQKPGCIRHIYWTYIIGEREGGKAARRHLFRDVILRMYWDKETDPSVECPLGDFFGVGNCVVRPFRSLMMTTNPGGTGTPLSYGFNCYFPMPYKSDARIEIENASNLTARIWFHVDCEEYDRPPADIDELGRFHAQWRRENPTQAVNPSQDSDKVNLDGKENYVILEAEGKGNLAGYILTVDNITGGWWGEGDDMIFIDGEKWPPSLHGTGTEEIFGGGASPATEYYGPYAGFHIVTNYDGSIWKRTNSMYRFFVNDPIHFQKSIKVTVEHGHANALSNDYSSVAFWYQSEPHRKFPKLPDAAQRAPREHA